MSYVKCETCGIEYPDCQFTFIYHSTGLPKSGTAEDHKTVHKHEGECSV